MTPEQPRQRPKSYAESVMDGEVDQGAGWRALGKRVRRQQLSQQFITWATLVFAATGAVAGILALVLH